MSELRDRGIFTSSGRASSGNTAQFANAFDRELTRGDDPTVEIVDPEGRDKTFKAGRTEPGATNRATFTVKVHGDEPVECTVKVLSTRGGVLERTITLGGGDPP